METLIPPSAVTFELPFPPSVNHYWRMWRGRMVIGARGRAYRSAVCSALRRAVVRPLDGELAVRVEAFPPDRKRRDLDNLLKAIGDSLERGGAFHDDAQIVWLLIERADVVAGGMIRVQIWPRSRGTE